MTLITNRTKPNRMLFYLAVRMTFSLITEPNRIANTPYIIEYNLPSRIPAATPLSIICIMAVYCCDRIRIKGWGYFNMAEVKKEKDKAQQPNAYIKNPKT
jgi:hypothetical protein